MNRRAAAGVCLSLFAVLVPVGSTAAQDSAPAVVPDVVYGHKLGMALTLDVFKPAGRSNGAGIVYMVSGGWISRWSPPAAAVRRFQPFLDKGFTVFAVRHGSSPRFKVPEAVSDVRLALRYLSEHAAEHGVDPRRLGVHGGSAGGHLSLMLGLAPEAAGDDGQETRVAAVVAFFPPVDLRELVGPSRRFPALDFDPEVAPSISPILFATADDPPTLLVHGTADQLVPIRNSEIMLAALRDRGVTSELLVLEGAGHGFRAQHRQQATDAMVTWFERHLAPRTAR